MKILITGSDGYIGNALARTLEMRKTDHEFLRIDTGFRESWVKEIGGCSLTAYRRIPFLYCNLCDPSHLFNILQYFRPEIIVHLASQPSGPYSEISSKHRSYTQLNNISMLENLLNVSHDIGITPKFIVTTTTGIPGAPNEPITESYMPNAAGSEYHMTRGWDSDNLRLAVRQWKLNVLELRTSIVYGTRTLDFEEPVTRFDWDFWFGTALNRFILSKKMNIPIKIYGKGLQKKPFISLRNTVKSIIKSIDYEVQGHIIMNQTTGPISILELAKKVGGKIEHIPNPRIENEDHQMIIHNEKFMKLLGEPISTLEEEITCTLKDIDTRRLPSDWKKVYEGKIPA